MRIVQFIQVPYDSGHKDYRMGMGPKAILSRVNTKNTFDVEEVDVQDRVPLEIGTSFAVARQLAGKVSNAIGRRAFPLVVAGNCISCIGLPGSVCHPRRSFGLTLMAISILQKRPAAVFWTVWG